MTKYDEIIDCAIKDIGYTESPKNSNKQKYGEWYGYNGVAWCMQAVQYWHAKIGCTLPYKTASCSGLLNWYKANKPECIKTEPKKGYIVIYNFGHTGIVESVGKGTITAIEGNTSSDNKGSQDNGGGVFKRVRSVSLVEAYIDGIDEHFPIIIEPNDEENDSDYEENYNSEEEDYMTRTEILAEIGDEYIRTFDELPSWAKDDMREILDCEIVNGGTIYQENPDDINMFLSDIRVLIATKRMIKKAQNN